MPAATCILSAEQSLCRLRLGSHGRWVDARYSASVVAELVIIPVGPHDQRASNQRPNTCLWQILTFNKTQTVVLK
jgi:hypothetical protein